MIRMRKRVAREKDYVGVDESLGEGRPDVLLRVAAMIVVCERQPDEIRTDDLTRAPVLLAAGSRRFPCRRESCGAVPVGGRTSRFWIVREDGDDADICARACG